MLIVTTPATDLRLTTVAAVRAMYGITTDQLNDAGVGTLIDRASAAAVSFCGRPFAREEVRQVEYLTAPIASLVLERMQADTATVEVTEGTTDLVRDTDFVVAEDVWSLYRLAGNCRRAWCARTVEITYTAGYVLPADAEGRTLPHDVEDACLRLVGDLWKIVQGQQPGLLKRERVDGVGEWEWFMPGATSQLANPIAELLLAPYRRISF